ncbi:hypothetical protein E2C01_088554 [Portunus trituberculatus]|uniref:Uncharacterized protein n=1 Tax=Portunus trituberculatus TaxID=210409 RepID=A0A5B7JK76_PORTR|nr:hypothetical protein [Portunus trituberculatus]
MSHVFPWRRQTLTVLVKTETIRQARRQYQMDGKQSQTLHVLLGLQGSFPISRYLRRLMEETLKNGPLH